MQLCDYTLINISFWWHIVAIETSQKAMHCDMDDEDTDDECLLINTSIPGYHISLAYLPALNYSCDMDIRPISIYFMDHNSQNWTKYFILVLLKFNGGKTASCTQKSKEWFVNILLCKKEKRIHTYLVFCPGHICNFVCLKFLEIWTLEIYVCQFLLLLLVRSLNLWFMQTFVSIDIPSVHISLRLPGLCTLLHPP